jgi:hypothetical protein
MLCCLQYTQPKLARLVDCCHCNQKYLIQNKQYTSIYVGYGIKTQQQLYFPIGPSDLNEEGEDIIEFPEPNPKDPPDEIEPDSDEEAKK